MMGEWEEGKGGREVNWDYYLKKERKPVSSKIEKV